MEADLDRQSQGVGPKRTGEAGAIFAIGQDCRKASPVRRLK